MVLLVSASLMIRSFVALQKVDLGFQPENVMSASVPLPPKRYATWEQRNRFAHDLLERVRNTPGVVAATIGNGGLPFGGPASIYSIDSQSDTDTRWIMIHAVGADYLSTLGIPVLRGRMLTEREVDAADHVAVINEVAGRLWPHGENPVGQRIRLNELEKPGGQGILTPANPSPYVTVVGVIGNTRNDDLRTDSQPAALVPYTLRAPSSRTLAIRSQGDPLKLVNSLRRYVQELDGEVPLTAPTTLVEVIGVRTAQPRFTMVLFSLFAVLGLALALAGIYSVLSYLVAMRTREIGVRMALGAQRSEILRLILRSGFRLVGAGLIIGILASFATVRLLESKLNLFQVTAGDPGSYLSVALLIIVVAAAACLIPARRATRIDPMVALRYD